MQTRFVFLLGAAIFLGLAATRLLRGRPPRDPQVRTWLLIGAIFAGVAAWRWFGP